MEAAKGAAKLRIAQNHRRSARSEGRRPTTRRVETAIYLHWAASTKTCTRRFAAKREAFRFLADRGIKWWSSSRSGDRPGGTHPTRNLASSQVACINFLLPLAPVPEALAAIVAAIDHDDIAVTEITDPRSGTSSPVEFEWIGLDHSLEGPSHTTRGANTTSVDAFIIAETRTGRCAYLIEWKYVEEYRRKVSRRRERG